MKIYEVRKVKVWRIGWVSPLNLGTIFQIQKDLGIPKMFAMINDVTDPLVPGAVVFINNKFFRLKAYATFGDILAFNEVVISEVKCSKAYFYVEQIRRPRSFELVD